MLILHRSVRTAVLVAAATIATIGAAPAQVKAPTTLETPYAQSSASIDNPTAATQMVWQHLVEIPYAGWLQMKFSGYSLPGASYVEIRSFKDGAVQRLDRAMMKNWFPRSAYFNGDAVLVRLFAGPQTRGARIDLAATVVGVSPIGNDTICGPTDDRVNSNDARTCRLLPVGCTAWIATPNGLLLTAGHCLGRSNPVVQFNVPQSLSNGTLQHPPPIDQYTVTQELAGAGNGTGCDWGIMLAGTNNQNQTPLQRQNAFFVLRTVAPTANATIRITGYGSASGTRNQTQKTHTGPFTTLGAAGNCSGNYRLQYQTDTTGGNSGSPVIDDATNQAVGIHTHGGCNSSGGGANSGTFLLNANFQAALSTLFVQLAHAPLADTADVVNNYVVRSTIVSGGSNISSAVLTYAVNGGTPTTVGMLRGSGDEYSAAIPAQPAVARISYSLTATDANNNQGSIGPFTFTVGHSAVLFSDDFETATGWTPDPGDNAATGRFERADPFASGQNQPEDDNTPNGTICYITENGLRGQTTSQHDVDSGKTSIVSPTFDLSGVPAGTATLEFAYWLVILTQLNDFLQVDVSTDNGSSWTQIWRDTTTQSAWRLASVTIPGTYTNQMKVRLWVQDNPNDSLTDCCIDDVIVKTVDDNVAALTANTSTPAIGTTVNYTLGAAREPNGAYIYAVSLASAKTTLAGIGTLDLAPPIVPLVIGGLGGTGTANFAVAVPNAPVVRGLTVYTQAVVSGGTNIVSNLWTLKVQ